MPKRRTVLIGLGGTIAIAGCTGDSDEEEESGNGGNGDPEEEESEPEQEKEPQEEEEEEEEPQEEEEEEPQEEEDLEPGEFQFTNLTPGDTTVEYGTTVNVEVIIKNIGEEELTEEIEYFVGEETLDTAEYTLDGGEDITITANIETLLRQEGEHEYGFSTTNDETTATLTVELEQPNPIQFSGNGAEVSDTFDIEGGMVVIEFEHSGDRNFIVDLVDPSGSESDELVANDIGNVEGAWGQGIPEGEYALDIEADGSWSIDVIQPRVTLQDGETLPFSTSGSFGDWFVVNTEGSARISASHSGESNFVVSSYEITGSRHRDTLVFNEIGEYDGETTFSYDYATFFVVQAGGSWELEFEEL